MRPVHLLFALRLVSLFALSVSLALLLDYITPEMAFCQAQSGCGKVRSSGLGYVVLPSGAAFPYLPLLGFLGFAGLFSASLVSRADLLRVLVTTLASASAVGAVVLILLQAFVIGDFCSLCLLVDGSALLIGVCAFLLRGRGFEDALTEERSQAVVEHFEAPLSESHRVVNVWQEDSHYVAAPHPTVPRAELGPLRLTLMGWLALAAIALGAPIFYGGAVQTEEVPRPIASLYQAGSVNVIEFFDYQCPHCRVALPTLEEAIDEFGRPVHLVRLPVILPGHPLGKVAGRLHVCAAEQGREEAVARVLLSPGALTEEMIERASHLPGLDRASIEACLESERPDQVLDQALERIKQSDFVGLPTTYIGSSRLLGAQPEAAYLAALTDSARGTTFSGVSPPLYWALVALLALAVGVAARVRPTSVLGRTARAARK